MQQYSWPSAILQFSFQLTCFTQQIKALLLPAFLIKCHHILSAVCICRCKGKCLLLPTITLNINKTNRRECDCCELLWITGPTNAHVHLVPCLLHHFPTLPYRLFMYPLQGLLSKAHQSQGEACYELQRLLNEIWFQSSASNLTADTTLKKDKIPMHWLQLNCAVSERKALFGVEQYKIDFYLLPSE